MSELTVSAIADAGEGCVSVTAASSGACSGPGGRVPGASRACRSATEGYLSATASILPAGAPS